MTGSAKSAGGDVASSAKSAAGDAKGAAQSAGRQIDQATPDLSGVFDGILDKVKVFFCYAADSFVFVMAIRQVMLFAISHGGCRSCISSGNTFVAVIAERCSQRGTRHRDLSL